MKNVANTILIREKLKSSKNIAILIFTTALILRLIYLLEICSNPFFANPITDSLWHDQWALQIATGNTYLGNLAFFRAPLYPYFLGSIYSIFGHSYFIPRLIQIFIGSISCVLIFIIGKRHFSTRTGFLAAILGTVYGPLIYYDCELLITSLFTFLTLVTIFLVGSAIHKKASLFWALPGIALGLAAIARPTALVLIPGVIILWLLHRREIKWKIAALSFFIGLIVTIAPVTIRNYIAEKDFVLISSQAGINYFIGNNPLSDGKTAKAPSMDKPPMGVQDHIWYSSVKVAEQIEGKTLKSSAVSTFWFKRGLSYLLEDPVGFTSLQLEKLYLYINGYEGESNLSIYLHRRFSSLFSILVWVFIIAFPLGIVLPLSIVGMIMLRNQWKKLFILYYIIVAYSISVIAFFVTARFRIPLIPYFLMFIAYAIVYLVDKLKNKDRQFFAFPSMIIFSALIIITNSNFFGVRSVNKQREHYLLGFAYAREESYSKAEKELKASLAYHDDPLMMAQVYYILGDIYCVQQRYGDAEKAYIEAVNINPRHAKVFFQLGNLYSILGFYDRAEYAYRRALMLAPDFKEAQVNLEILLKNKGQIGEDK